MSIGAKRGKASRRAGRERTKRTDMNTLEQLAGQSAPDWLVAEMPPGYQNRVAEIRRLYDDLHAMTRFGALLCANGSELADIIGEFLASLRLDVQRMSDSAASFIVRLD